MTTVLIEPAQRVQAHALQAPLSLGSQERQETYGSSPHDVTPRIENQLPPPTRMCRGAADFST